MVNKFDNGKDYTLTQVRARRTVEIVNAVVVMALVLFMFFNITLNNKNTALETYAAETIKSYENVIDRQMEEIAELKVAVTQLQGTIASLQSANDKLLEDKAMLEAKVDDLLKQLEKSKEIPDIETTNRDFKSYMPYTVITDRTSKQWPLQQQATTNEVGIRCINGIPMIAIGTGWGPRVGDTVLVTCENGNSFVAIVGDIKSNVHTDKENKTTNANGCRCEFIVDLSVLDETTRVLGNIAATMPEYTGYVVSIVKVNLHSNN